MSTKTLTQGQAYGLPSVTRRNLLMAVPVALAASAPAQASNIEAPNDRILALIDQLENAEGWEIYAVICAKAWAAHELRKAVGLEVPESEYVSAHHHMLADGMQAYERTQAHLAEIKALRGV